MAVRNYIHEYMVKITNKKQSTEDYIFSDSSSELEDFSPLIQKNLEPIKMWDSEQIYRNRMNPSSFLKVSFLIYSKRK